MELTTDITGSHNDSFSETYQLLKQEFAIEPTGYIDFQLNNFEVFKQYSSFELQSSYVINTENDRCYILFIEACVKSQSTTGEITEHRENQTWGLAYLKHNLGRVKIRRETFTDKLFELVFPLEIDFKEDKAFSNTFYVLANDKPKAIAGITRDFRNAVMDIREDDLIIEVADHTLLIGNRKPITGQKAIHMAEFVTRLVEICD
ncbi:hypothetical protein LJ707_20005 [Mucilaginibacter sp. UR6-1]|uniref:hypothetical protein n=1 Tax=Mucilaginibacter sp. UR6-1 TaxID=1435643 RepID=UPI001E48E3D8|nr:hypothetical protein [Mucilaginibacter sp. UR6-1]MCC8411235.1 hypothetical protein [Mucilaginibacter sp. UR6-1]